MRELARQGFPGLAAHDDFVTRSGFAEEFHVVFDMKDKLVFFTELTIFTDACNDTEHITP